MKALVFVLARLHVDNLPEPGTVTTDSMTAPGIAPFLPSLPSPSPGSVQPLPERRSSATTRRS
jgi:hypothetical protein